MVLQSKSKLMKRIVLFLSVSFMLFVSGGCIKDNMPCKQKTVESEDAAMVSFAASNGITATKHSSGMYYQIINPGSGATPVSTSTLSVKYKGTLTDGNIFDQQTTTPVSFSLSGVIAGWQLGMPLIKKGGTIKLIIPSSYGYGCTANGPIPAYSVLYFEIELIDVL
jgi:FKBP-type peptidyl-prolyl cis-trans isomerase FkpA